MIFKSTYFKTVQDALGAASNLVEEDRDPYNDRQILANFYNGREIETEAEGEDSNSPSLVNHLFGYNALNGFKLQVGAVYNSGDYIWNVKSVGDEIPVSDRGSHSAVISAALDKAIKRSRRYKPEHRAMAGEVVLHGRCVLMHMDTMDWCPRVTHCYVPAGTPQLATAVPYAFVASSIKYHELREHLRHSQNNPGQTHWNSNELGKLLKYMEKNGALTVSNESNRLNEEQEQQSENQYDQMATDRSTAMELPVWYIYEVDHKNPDLPVSLKIVTRYDISETRRDIQNTMPANSMIFSHEDKYKRVEQWIHPVFMDTEIGGKATWQSVTGIARLNYDRDGDVEEFFNLAMEGAKDKMRTKWMVADGASREKLQRFFAEKQDMVPEGVTPVENRSDPGYQHSFNVINILRQLSKEDSGGGNTNLGAEGEELEIQAAERQQKAGFQVASRMDDVYEAMDSYGHEILRRFLAADISKDRIGYAEINRFRKELESEGVPIALYSKTDENGELVNLEIKTSRAAGDGSESGKRLTNQSLMSSLGLYSAEAQELIKRKNIRDLTRDPDFAKEVVPFEPKVDPDQLARARNENTAALQRGVTGFIPEISNDDLDQVHSGEHQNALDAHVMMGRIKGFFDQAEGKGFESLATHQMTHVRRMQQADVNGEMANQFFQELQKQTREAEALIKQGEQKVESDKIDPMEVRKADQKDRELGQKDRVQDSLEKDRQARNSIDSREAAVKEVVETSKVAQGASQILANAGPTQ